MGYALTVTEVVAVVGGTGVATKATVEAVLRKRMEHQLRAKSIIELIDLSHRLT